MTSLHIKNSFCLKMLLLASVVLVTPNRLHADDVSLELVYITTDYIPAEWYLFAEIINTGSGNDGSHGLASVRALIDDIEYGNNGDEVHIWSGIGSLDPIDPGIPNERAAVLQTAGGTVDILYQQDLLETVQPVVGGIGVGGKELIAHGRQLLIGPDLFVPSFGDDDFGLTSSAYFLDAAAPGPYSNQIPADNVILQVRQQFVFMNDLNGDGFIDGLDLGILLGNWGQSGLGYTDGELNNSDPVDSLDLGILLGAWNPPPAAANIPEPSAFALVLLASCAVLMKRGKF